MQIQYYISFALAIVFLIVSVVLYFVLSIRQIGRYLKNKGKKVPNLMNDSDKPLFKRHKKDNQRDRTVVQKTVVLDDEVIDCERTENE